MSSLLWIAAGSALGGVARYLTAAWVGARLDADFPWGTFAVNVLGSFLIGMVAALIEAGPESRTVVRHFLMTGFLGGFTTFSAFSLQTWTLIQQRAWLAAGGNMAGSVLLCLGAVAAGYELGRRIAAH